MSPLRGSQHAGTASCSRLFPTAPLPHSAAHMLRRLRSFRTKMETQVTIAGKKVPVSAAAGIDVSVAINAQQFKDWMANIDPHALEVRSVHFQSLDMFGPRVGFIKFKADVIKDSKPVPGIVFMRGGSVAILTLLRNNGRRFALCTVQPRVPIGRMFLEVPAGMLDGSGNFTGKAAAEMKEETSIVIDESKLVDLSEWAWHDKYPGMYPSPGGCDEFIRLFAYQLDVDDAKMKELEGKVTGELAENEDITVAIVPYGELFERTSDSKSLACMYLYDKWLAAGGQHK